VKMTLATKVTLMRLLLVPLILFLMALKTPVGFLCAEIVFILASLTDWLDGYLARVRNEITNLGKFLDQIVDKLLIVPIMIAFAAFGELAWWYVVMVVMRDTWVSGMRMAVASNGVVIAASMWGKWKTGSQMALLIVLFTNLSLLGQRDIIYFPEWFVLALLVISMLLTLYSGWDYTWKARRVLFGEGK